MDKQPVGQLPDLTQSNNDDEIMVITNSEYNQLKKEKIADFITDLTSTDENNAIVKGTDGKLFTKNFGNAANITEGTLPVSVLPDIPKNKLPEIETADLPVSGVTADTYAYPSSVTVNSQGQVTAIEEGTPSGANADTDLSNLTAEGEKHFINKTQLTNCILEAPERIKVEFTTTSITLKSGSIVTMPDGSEVSVNSDIVHTWTSSRDGNAFLIYNPTTQKTQSGYVGYGFSGTTRPSSPTTSYIWLDTTNEVVEYYNGASWESGYSLPFLIFNYTGNNSMLKISSVFNTFGAMGGTFWVQKGVKFLMPNGRNADGSLNNTEYTTDSIKFYNITDGDVAGMSNITKMFSRFVVTTNGIGWWGEATINNGPVYLNTTRVDRHFDEQKNLWYTANKAINYTARPNICVLSSFIINRVNSVFHIMDVAQIDPVHIITKTDRNWVARMASPSVKYEDYVGGASGQKLIAPACGWFIARKAAGYNSDFEYLNIYNRTANSLGMSTNKSSYNTVTSTVFVKVNKGDAIEILYSFTGAWEFLRFIYDEGAI